MKTRRSAWAGQALPLMAIALPVLLGVVALCTDIGVLYFNWAKLQKAADAAVLAGANFLPNNPANAQITAANFAAANGVQANEIVSNQVAPDDLSITMKLTRTVPFYFARVLGFTNTPVSAQATAGLQPVGGGNQFLPIGLPCSPGNCTYNHGQLVQLKMSDVNAPGNWEPLALGGNGGDIYRNSLKYGYQGPAIDIGQYVNVSTEPGNLVGPTQQGLQYRIDLSTSLNLGDSWSSPNPADPRVVLVPMVDFSGVNGKSQVPVTGFAAIWIDSVVAKNATATINAYFIDSVAGNGQPDPNAPNNGPYAPVLLR